MKLLFISTMPSCFWGGSEELWYANALEAKKKGHTVRCSIELVKSKHEKIVSLENKLNVSYRQKENNQLLFKKLHNKLIRLKDKLADIPHYYYTFYKMVKDFNPDFIIINQGGTFNVINHDEIVWLIKNYKSNYYLISQWNSEHYTYPLEIIDKINCIIFSFKQFFFVSERNLLVAERQICQNLNSISSIISNPLKEKITKIPEWPQSDTINFAFVGRLDCKTKGIDLLVHALSQTNWKNDKWTLNIYGSGDDNKYIKTLISFYKLENKINLKGNYNNLYDVWAYNSILILPSISEGLPLTIIEAMSYSRPIIATDVSDISKLVIDNKTGYLIKAPTLNLIKEKLDIAWEDRSNWIKKGKHAKNHIDKFISNNNSFNLLDKILNG